MSVLDTARVPTEVLVALVAFIPLALAVGLSFYRTPDRHERGGLALALTWVLVGVLALDRVAVDVGWWNYPDAVGSNLVTPPALLFGWVLMWGVAAPMFGWRPLPTVAGLGVLDVVAVPMLDPTVVLGPQWWIGEAIALIFIALPAVSLARWQATRQPDRLVLRLLLQLVLFAVTLLWIVPSVVLADPFPLPDLPLWTLGLVVGSLGLASLPGVAALVEFGLHGGTPWPWDYTERPIRSGPYRYVRSPMQASGFVLLAILAVLHMAAAVMLAAAFALGWGWYFSTTERDDLAHRWGRAWLDVADGQSRWLPSIRPQPEAESATLWIDLSCDPCSGVAAFLLERRPVGLELRAAVDHPDKLMRLRYERADGVSLSGIAAFGAALEHLHLGYAIAGWFLRMPLVAPALQFVGDACGFGERPAGSVSEPAAVG